MLGTPDLTYRRLSLVLRHLPRTSATARVVSGEAADWSLTDHLLAAMHDQLTAANWQRGGGKGKRPKPIPRPGVEDKTVKHYGSEAMSLEEARRVFAREAVE